MRRQVRQIIAQTSKAKSHSTALHCIPLTIRSLALECLCICRSSLHIDDDLITISTPTPTSSSSHTGLGARSEGQGSDGTWFGSASEESEMEDKYVR